eukprot:jgi/Botrbrau1/18554/Bobra.0367s0005.1
MALRLSLRCLVRNGRTWALLGQERLGCSVALDLPASDSRERSREGHPRTQASALRLDSFDLNTRRIYGSNAPGKVQISVAPMGESITEGTISAILKNAGDKVDEDEPIAQIETDKVTFDVRAPQAGIIQQVLVKVDENVNVGQVVAILGSAEDVGAAVGAPQAVSTPAVSPSTPSAGASSVPQAAEASHAQARQPHIHFPPRTTPEGIRISSLPASQQAQWESGQSTVAPQPSKAVKQEPRVSVPVGRWYVGVERGSKLSQSRVLSDREMEMIELGGAPP